MITNRLSITYPTYFKICKSWFWIWWEAFCLSINSCSVQNIHQLVVSLIIHEEFKTHFMITITADLTGQSHMLWIENYSIQSALNHIYCSGGAPSCALEKTHYISLVKVQSGNKVQLLLTETFRSIMSVFVESMNNKHKRCLCVQRVTN